MCNGRARVRTYVPHYYDNPLAECSHCLGVNILLWFVFAIFAFKNYIRIIFQVQNPPTNNRGNMQKSTVSLLQQRNWVKNGNANECAVVVGDVEVGRATHAHAIHLHFRHFVDVICHTHTHTFDRWPDQSTQGAGHMITPARRSICVTQNRKSETTTKTPSYSVIIVWIVCVCVWASHARRKVTFSGRQTIFEKRIGVDFRTEGDIETTVGHRRQPKNPFKQK